MDIDFLRNVSLFKGLNEEGLEALAELCFTREFAKEGVIILAEEEGDALFIIKAKLRCASQARRGAK